MLLYYSKGACSLVIRIIINEIGLQCDYESVDLRAKKTEKNEDYFKINPKGSVPLLITETKQKLTENAVIQQYLADTTQSTQLLPAIGDFNRYRVLEWLNYVSTDMHKGFSPFFNPNVPDEIKINVFLPLVKNRLSYINSHLEHNDYLAGDHFTLPDSYLFVVLRWTKVINLSLSDWPNIARYVAAINNMSSVQKSLKEEDLEAISV